MRLMPNEVAGHVHYLKVDESSHADATFYMTNGWDPPSRYNMTTE